jgi:hypothetical protein
VWLSAHSRGIGRIILNTLPEWLLFIVFAGGTAVVCVAALLIVRRYLEAWRSIEWSQVVVGVSAMVMTLFALILALAVVTLEGSFGDARDSVQNEANSLTELIEDMRVFPPSARRRVNAAVRAYANEVRGKEFDVMHEGETDPVAALELHRLITAVQSVQPATLVQRSFYDSAAMAVSRILDERHERLAAATGSLPSAYWILIFLTGATGLATTLLLRAHTLAVEVVMVTAVALVVGAGILTTLLLDYPFSGSIAVSSTPFDQVLAHVPAGTR